MILKTNIPFSLGAHPINSPYNYRPAVKPLMFIINMQNSYRGLKFKLIIGKQI